MIFTREELEAVLLEAAQSGRQPMLPTTGELVQFIQNMGAIAGSHLIASNLQAPYCILDGSHLEDAHLEASNLEGASLLGVRAIRADFIGAIMRGIRADRLIAAGARFDCVDAMAGQFRDMHACGSSWVGANLRNAVLTSSILEHASLKGACLVGANLHLVNLRKANLCGADLSYADLSGADLTDANIEGTTLTGAILQGTTRRRG